MKRYKITPKLIKSIQNSPYTINKLSKLLGFSIKNIIHRNTSIREDHLQKIKDFLKIDLPLKEIHLDYIKNLGTSAYTKPIKSLQKSKELAEFIGIMLGDGNLHKNATTIAFNKKDINYIKYVDKLFSNLFGIKFKNKTIDKKNTTYLYCYNKFLAEKLIDFGLKRGNKLDNQLGIPEWIKQNKDYQKSCIKGLIDTDGCIYICKRERQKYIKFTNHNQQLMDDFKKINSILEFPFAKSGKTNTVLYRKDKVVNFINQISPFKSRNGVVI